jgi:SNF2 family DNA or RNA helicase
MIGMIETGESVALWADMGLGKTATVLTAIERRIYDQALPTRALVLAPKFVAENTWPAEVGKWDHLEDLKLVVVSGGPQERWVRLQEDADVYVMCRNNLPWLFDQYTTTKSKRWSWRIPWPFDLVVLDESSAYKNPSGAWFKAMARVARSGCQIIELTGTPSPKGLEDLWAQVYLLDQGARLEDGVTKFRSRYLDPDKRIYQGGRDLVVSYRPKPGAFEEVMAKVADRAISLRAEDWLRMPERLDVEVKVALQTKALAAYKKMEQEAVLALQGGLVTAGSPATVIGKLLQMANGRVYDEEGVVREVHRAKLEALKEIIADAQNPVLVFYSYVHDAEVLPGVKLSTTGHIEAWNRGEIPVMYAHPASAGHGLNLQGGGNIVIWYGLPYNLEWYQQANARILRQGQRRDHVVIHHLIAEGTVDEQVVRILKKKDALQADVIDAVRWIL